MLSKRIHDSRGRIFLALGLLGVFVVAFIPPVSAALCVWRNPDRDMKDLFGADSYKTLWTKVGNKRATIEKRLNTKLDPDETEFRFWPVYKNGKRVGTITTHLGKGDYGAIEVVIALKHNDEKVWISAVRIQRDREKYRNELRSEGFLKQFVGKTSKDPLQVGKDLKAAHAKALKGSQVVALSVKKLLVAFEELQWATRNQ